MGGTILDLAHRAGVSLAAASRALNNSKGISDEKRQLVLMEAEKMGYRPNEVARVLRGKKSKVIGLVIPDIENPFFPELALGIDTACRKAGYSMMVSNSCRSGSQERMCLEALYRNRVDGIIIEPTLYKNINYLHKLRISTVCLNTGYRGTSANIVNISNENGAFMAVSHLLNRGYSRIAYIGGSTRNYSNRCRLNGYLNALAVNGIAADPEFILEGSYETLWGYRASGLLFEKKMPPDAIFAANDVIALGIIQYVQEHGISVPNQLGVVGFDDIYAARLPGIDLTTVSIPKDIVGHLAFKRLLALMQPTEHVYQNEEVPLELIVRKTTK